MELFDNDKFLKNLKNEAMGQINVEINNHILENNPFLAPVKEKSTRKFDTFEYTNSLMKEFVKPKNDAFASMMGTNAELNTYLREDWKISSDNISSSLDYWSINKLRFPTLSNLAVKYLAIQATETPCESQFSITGYFDNNYRRRKISYKKFKHLTFIKLRNLDK